MKSICVTAAAAAAGFSATWRLRLRSAILWLSTAANRRARVGHGQLPFTFRSWQREQGLPQNSVRALAQTQRWLSLGGQRRRRGALRRRALCFVWLAGGIAQRAGARHCWGQPRRAVDWQRGRRLEPLAGWPVHHLHDARTACRRIPSPPWRKTATGRLWVGTEAGLVVWQNGQLAPLEGSGGIQGQSHHRPVQGPAREHVDGRHRRGRFSVSRRASSFR